LTSTTTPVVRDLERESGLSSTDQVIKSNHPDEKKEETSENPNIEKTLKEIGAEEPKSPRQEPAETE